jgi:uncharacterized protein (TIRG00374 family)
LSQTLRAALAIAPLVWIYTRTGAAALGENLAAVSAPLLAAILALLFAGMLLQGVKWWVLIRRFAPELKLRQAVSVHLESAFYSIMLPAAAQDVVKSVMLSKNHPPSVVWAASWLARPMGFFSLLIFSAAGIIYLDSGILPNGFRASLLTAVAAIAALGAASFSKRVTRPFRSAAAKILSPKIMAKIEELRNGIYVFKYERATLVQTFLISFATQFLIIFTIALQVYAVSGNLYFTECLAFVPLVEIMVVSLPLTPGGLGVREALMALLFTRLGLSDGQIATYVTISLAGSMVRIAGGMPVLWRMVTKRK